MKSEFGKAVEYVQFLIKNLYIGKDNLSFVDCTAGNGYDTLFLSKIAGKNGKVFSFDIQNMAIERTKELLQNNVLFNNYQLINDSHENLDKYIKNNLDCAVFNLGYLPYSDKELKTKPDTTITAIMKLIKLLKQEGKIFIIAYVKHDNGKERDEVFNYIKSLDKKNYNVLNMKIINKNNCPPELFIIEKKCMI